MGVGCMLLLGAGYALIRHFSDRPSSEGLILRMAELKHKF